MVVNGERLSSGRRAARSSSVAVPTRSKLVVAPGHDAPPARYSSSVTCSSQVVLVDGSSALSIDYDQVARDAAAMLRLEAGRNPHDKALIELVGELSTHSELFRQRWASQDVRYHRSGRKRLRHPAVGQLDLDFEALELPVRTRPAAQHLHRRRRHPHLRRPQAARLLGGQPGVDREREDP